MILKRNLVITWDIWGNNILIGIPLRYQTLIIFIISILKFQKAQLKKKHSPYMTFPACLILTSRSFTSSPLKPTLIPEEKTCCWKLQKVASLNVIMDNIWKVRYIYTIIHSTSKIWYIRPKWKNKVIQNKEIVII